LFSHWSSYFKLWEFVHWKTKLWLSWEVILEGGHGLYWHEGTNCFCFLPLSL
jgi:hypothetical protein